MSHKLTKWLILTVLLAYAVFVSAWAASRVHARHCTGIDIDIRPAADGRPSFLRPKAVLGELGSLAQYYSKTPLYDINTDSLEKHLNTVNNFEHAEVTRTTTGCLHISVTPLIPEARVFTSVGSYYINKDGKRMDAEADYFTDLPIIRGNFTNRMPPAGVLPVVRYIKKDKLLSSLITMIEYRNPDNILLTPRIRGHIINLGDTTDLPAKFEKLLLMYRKVMPYQGWNTYDTISLKFKGQIVATRIDKNQRRHNNIDPADIEDYEEAALLSETQPLTPDNPQNDQNPD